MHWYLNALKHKYAKFDGRARRAEYWYFVLCYALVVWGLMFIDYLTGTFVERFRVGLLSGIYVALTWVPALAVTVRRLHDTDRSGWWVLAGLVPIVGEIVVFVFTVLDSDPGANRFGENPKEMESAALASSLSVAREGRNDKRGASHGS